jgi:tRNA nucleotidyltransferase (CCA-adding enzyme)
MQALDYAARAGFPLPVRYAVLTHDLGKALSPPDGWPRHIGHEARGVRLAEGLSARLRVPVDCRDAARLTTRYHSVVHRALQLRPATLLDLLVGSDALRRPERLDTLVAACSCDALSRPGCSGGYPPGEWLQSALAVVKGVAGGEIAQRVAARAAPRRLGPEAVPAAIRAARLAALRAWRKGRGDGSASATPPPLPQTR